MLKYQQNNTIQIYHDESLESHQRVHKIIKAIF